MNDKNSEIALDFIKNLACLSSSHDTLVNLSIGAYDGQTKLRAIYALKARDLLEQIGERE